MNTEMVHATTNELHQGPTKAKTNEHISGVESSAASIKQSHQLASNLCKKILDLAYKAGRKGITINEVERSIEDHKGHSISPRFVGLVREGLLVRVLVGRGKPTRGFPQGRPLFYRRYDEETCRCVIVHWLPEFLPFNVKQLVGAE